ncbi:HlyD family type I secretion periplasmic adaptor subunit [Arenicella chitinivorans]|uniref:HlyD family type I secretion periplasmic adaptor subunit n=1 Tax=Arenicella chitinivorans TaxID=1329800 RepID=A0A918RRM3_9GAMM|nr:HlyD family efflux transporter periplasmic adaptor subunit [Arenicella chitinivorans]GHA10455.1 HlyD family type I secretion periplasmic adaptor subunit [Arenicella chitinivorans]
MSRINSKYVADRLPIFVGISILLSPIIVIVLLNFVPVTEQIEQVEGVISSDSGPRSLRAERQFLVRKNHVRVNQHVQKGDLLVEFDDQETRRTLEMQRLTIEKLEFQIQTLESQQALISENVALLEDIHDQKAQKKVLLAAQQGSQKKLLDQQKELSVKAVTTAKKLSQSLANVDSRSISELRRLEILRSTNSTIGELQTLEQKLSEQPILHALKDIEASIELSSIREKIVSSKIELNEIATQLNDAQQKIKEEQLAYQNLMTEVARFSIRAPITGTVAHLSDNLNKSNMINKDEVILIISPDVEPTLKAQLALTDEQYKDARVAQNVNLEIWAWNHFKHGVVTGKVVAISPEKVTSELLNKPSYIADVEILQMPKDYYTLKRGFSLKANIDIGTISLLDYILKKFNLEKPA